jgi:hypothetical protein
MLIKGIMLFLIGMAVLAMFGRLRFPKRGAALTCQGCGRPRLGQTPCACGHRG